MMPLDLAKPAQLSLALLPDLVLMGGAMMLTLWAGWRRESDAHQRNVGLGSILLCLITIAAVSLVMGRYDAVAGPVALDGFRWMTDIVILLGAMFAVALTIDDNRRAQIATAESHVLTLLAAAGMMLLAAGRDLII